MNRTRTHRTCLLGALTILLAGVFVVVQSAHASGLVRQGAVPAGQVVERDVLLTGDYVQLDGTVDGDVLAVGRTIIIAGDVSGSLVAVGERISVLGRVDGSIYAAGVSLDMWPSSTIGRSVHFVGARIVTQQASEIGRDLIAISLGADLSGKVGREVNARVGPMELLRLVTDALGKELRLFGTQAPAAGRTSAGQGEQAQSGDAQGAASLIRASYVSPSLAEGEVREGMRLRPASGPVQQDEPERASEWRDWAVGLGQNFVSLLIVGVLAIWLLPKLLDRAVKSLRTRPLPATGYGLVVYVTGYGAAFVIALLISALGIALLTASLTKLAWIFWGVSFSALGLAFFSFLAFAIYGSKIVVGYLVGQLILERLAPKATRRIWPLLLGLVLYALVRSIPLLGWVVDLVVSIVGLGAVWLAYTGRHECPDAPEEAEEQPEGE